MRALRHLFPRVIEYGDQLIVALLAGTALVEVLASGESVLDAVVGAAVALPLLARRRAPLLVLVAVIAARLRGLRARCERGRLAAGLDRAQRRALQRGGALRAHASRSPAR